MLKYCSSKSTKRSTYYWQRDADSCELENSFEKVKPHAPGFSANFINIYSEANPKLRAMFRDTDLEKQQQKLMSALTLLVGNVRNPDLLVPVLQDLGAKHKGYGVIKKHYPTVGAALLQTFEQSLKEDWTPEVKQAWMTPLKRLPKLC